VVDAAAPPAQRIPDVVRERTVALRQGTVDEIADLARRSSTPTCASGLMTVPNRS
jgi:hypothetical protein